MSENITFEKKKHITVLFAGDSGDGMQLTGTQFTNTNALYGNDVSTFPNFPAEIRAPHAQYGRLLGRRPSLAGPRGEPYDTAGILSREKCIATREKCSVTSGTDDNDWRPATPS